MPRRGKRASDAARGTTSDDTVLKTICLPRDLWDAVVPVLSMDPEGDNFSKYVRTLMRNDIEKKKAAYVTR